MLSKVKNPVKISQVNLSQGSHFFNLMPGKYSGLLLEYISSTNNTGVVSETSFGNIIIKFGGKEIVNSGFTKLRENMLNEFNTKLPNVLASGSALNNVVYIPFHKNGHEFNVLEVTNDCYVEITGLATTNMGGTPVLNVYGVMNPYGIAAYLLKHFTKSIAYPAGSAVYVNMGDLQNTTKLLIGASSNITYLYVTRNNKLVFQAPLNIAKAITALNGIYATYADPSYWGIELVDKDNFDEMINKDLQIKLDLSSATTVEYLIQQISFNSQEMFEFSQSSRTTFVNSILSENERIQARNVKFIQS